MSVEDLTSEREFVNIPKSDEPVPVQIITADNHTFQLDEEALGQILLSEEVRDRPVVVISVAGAFRKGKSFLLDFFLRYLSNNDGGESDEWIGGDDDPLTGFSWRGGVERNTTGIYMWSKPFINKLPSGQEVAVLLMDTQGAFDHQATVKDCATIFALSTMISSTEVYNLSQMIQENDLQHLHLFTDYGRLAVKESDQKPFQSLCFLVRDWCYPYEHEYGNVGGETYLDKVLQLSDSQHEEIRMVRAHIRDCFESLSCFLLPHPGLKVATNPTFDGRLSDIDNEFKEYLKKLTPQLLAPKNLVVKRINGNIMTGSGLQQCFKSYIKIFESEELPEPKSMLEATAEANNLTALAAAFNRYNKEMEEVCGPEKPYMSPEELQQQHDQIFAACRHQFIETPKMGGDLYSSNYLTKLEEQIAEAYTTFVKINESKHLLNAYRTPAVLATVMVISYLISSVLDFIGIESLSRTAVIGLYLPLALVAVWVYARYSGNLRTLGQMIDKVTEMCWDEFLQPVYAMLMQKGVQQAVKLASNQGATGGGGKKKTS